MNPIVTTDHSDALRAATAKHNHPIHAGTLADGWARMRIPCHRKNPATTNISAGTSKTRIHCRTVITL